MKLRKAIPLIIVTFLFVGWLVTVVLTWPSKQLYVSVEEFLPNEVATVTLGNDAYYIVPGKALNSGTTFTNCEGDRYYVLSEEKLRLLGSEFLSILSKGTDE